MYSIIDIETTGGNQPGEKITEIAVYVHDGNQIIKSFHTLINPERNIPYNITRITGIDDRMVANAPKFYEVAKQIIELTENTIFVAHNVHFDYNFIKREFKDLGFDYNRQFVCTVKLSRQMLPGHASYSLGKICNDLNISINGRHRADGDALATTKLFEILLQKSTETILKEVQQFPVVTPKKIPDLIDKIPETTGVYFFKNIRNELIYIGKSRNIKKRVLSHFNNSSTKKAIELRNSIDTIDFEVTGSELISLIKESTEIKNHRPLYNKALKRATTNFGLFSEIDKNGYINFTIRPNSIFETPLSSFSNIVEGREELFRLVEKFDLCQKLSGLYKTDKNKPCCNVELKSCKGACIGSESTLDYNLKADNLINFVNPKGQNLIIIDKGRNDLEKSIVQIHNNEYIGWNYVSIHKITDLESLKNSIITQKNDKDIQKLIQSFIVKHKVEDIVFY